MAGAKINDILIPNVSKLPKHKSVDARSKLPDSSVDREEFNKLLKEEINGIRGQHGINVSVHAAKRLKERSISADSDEFFKLKGAMEKLKSKGGQDSLVITSKAAYILDVNNNKIVTAIDKDSMAQNVFTKIDSTLIVD